MPLAQLAMPGRYHSRPLAVHAPTQFEAVPGAVGGLVAQLKTSFFEIWEVLNNEPL